ncbi:DMT family transporter [Trujillonella humicola]|uniref:DMT family transporter n=1 Tax=Trujillonella humicola TaxID=3383699 RepID=UPI003905E091
MGPALCLVSAACFGAMAVFGKLAFAAGVPLGTLLLLRFSLAALLLGLVLLLLPGTRAPREPGRPRAGSLPRRVVVVGLGLGAVGYVTQAGLYFAALERVDASLVALVFYVYPALVTVVAVLLGRDRLTRARAAAVLVASAGTLLVLAGAGGLRFDAAGVAMAFGAAATYTVYILVADTTVHRVPPVVLSALVMTGAAATLALRNALTGGADLALPAAGWLWIGCIAVVSTVVAMLAFFAGLRRTGPSTAATLSTAEPVVTTALAALALGEFLTPVQLAGGLLVLTSVVLVQLRPRARRADPSQPVAVPVAAAPQRAPA